MQLKRSKRSYSLTDDEAFEASGDFEASEDFEASGEFSYSLMDDEDFGASGDSISEEPSNEYSIVYEEFDFEPEESFYPDSQPKALKGIPSPELKIPPPVILSEDEELVSHEFDQKSIWSAQSGALEYETIVEPTHLPSYTSTTEPSYTSTTPTPKPSPDDIVDEPSSTSFDSAIFSMPEELFPKALMAKEFKPSFWKGQFQTAKEVKTC